MSSSSDRGTAWHPTTLATTSYPLDAQIIEALALDMPVGADSTIDWFLEYHAG